MNTLDAGADSHPPPRCQLDQQSWQYLKLLMYRRPFHSERSILPSSVIDPQWRQGPVISSILQFGHRPHCWGLSAPQYWHRWRLVEAKRENLGAIAEAPANPKLVAQSSGDKTSTGNGVQKANDLSRAYICMSRLHLSANWLPTEQLTPTKL